MKTIYIVTFLLAAVFAGCEQPQSRGVARPCLYMFTAHAGWCGPCNAQRADVEAIKATGFFQVTEYDADCDTAAFAWFQVNDVPTYIVYCDGQEYFRGNDAHNILVTVGVAQR